jgi:hypothetical protein
MASQVLTNLMIFVVLFKMSSMDVLPGGDENPLMISLLSFKAERKILLIDDWLEDLGEQEDMI